MSEQIADSYEVSPQQEQLWLAEPEGPTGRVQALIALTGPLDADALRAALRASAARHETLRTTFVRRPGIRVPLQAVADELDPVWTAVDLGDLAGSEQGDRLEQLLAQERSEPLDHAAGPLTRAVLVTLGPDAHRLILTWSSLVIDASSAALVAAELVHALGGAEQLVEDPLQYADFAAWQRELQGSKEDEARAAAEFWTGVADLVSPILPFTSSSVAPFVAAGVDVELDDTLVAGLRAQAERYGSSAPALVHAVWQVLLARDSGSDEVVTAFLAADRRHADLEGAVGAFTRAVPIRTRAGRAVTFAELLSDVAQARDGALRWQDYAPVDGIGEITVGFVAADGYHGRAAGLDVTLEQVLSGDATLRLWLTCTESGERLALRIWFDPGSYGPDVAERLARQLPLLLNAVASDPGTAVGELPLLDSAERALLLEQFNDTAAPVPSGAVHELIAAAGAAAPDREAVRDEHGALTYAELDTRANQLAHRLRRAGVGPDVPVGLCTDRSTEMVVGMLGILKAGGAYLPLHYEHPPQRLAQQLSGAGARAIVTQEALLARLPEFEGELVLLDRDREALDDEPDSAPEVSVTPENLVYIIYTSGSTGTPKGVAVSHGNLVNYASGITRRLGADQEPLSFGMVTSISTDLGNTSLFGALCSGGTLVLISPVAAADPGALSAALGQTPIDVLKITPSHIGSLLVGDDPGVLPRRWLVIGGERAPWDLVSRVSAISNVRILNHYGPTEATVGCCTFAVIADPGVYAPATVPIGGPVANDACYVLDERLQPVPLGAPGRLFIGGAGVARGYVGATELTAERFLEDPFATTPGARMYDTGDVARWLPDGALEFLGRVDEQVKIRGYRVEPAEVETALRSHPVVREAVVTTWESAAGDVRLVAYCTVDGVTDPTDLRGYLGTLLPEFMLPSAIAVLDSFPQTPSGKVDRLALPDPETIGETTAADYVAPRTPLEETVAQIWCHVLGIERIGVEDDFFALGGHSLLATQVVAQVRSDFAVDLPLHSLFTYPTVASLTGEIMRMMGRSDEQETAALMAELEGLSDEEAERLLAGELPAADAENPQR
jgi:amino acid adenylation domain-containing protein